MKQNPADQWLESYYGKIPFADYALLDRAVRTLESNKDTRGFPGKFPWSPLQAIRPSDGYFNGIWNWDSAFAAMGVARWNPALARDQILLFCRIQEPDGMFPDVIWEEKGSIIKDSSKPPVMPWAAWLVEQQEHDQEFLNTAYDAFRRNEQFWMEKRGGGKYGLFHYDTRLTDSGKAEMSRKYETGWDDSPRWDHGTKNIFAVDLNCYMVLFYRAMAAMAAPAGHQEDRELWQQKAQTLSTRIEETLWDEKTGCYLDYDYENRAFSSVITPASFMPLFIRTASRERAEQMNRIAGEHFNPGWPSVSYRDPAYDPAGYWRGRTWLNIAYFALKGLHSYGFDKVAEEGRHTLLNWVRSMPGSIYENYNSETGLPAGAPRFSWSASFCIKFLLDWNLDEAMEHPPVLSMENTPEKSSNFTEK